MTIMTARASGRKAAVKRPRPPSMTDDQMRAFVLGCCDGRIFTSDGVYHPEDILMVFSFLMFTKDPRGWLQTMCDNGGRLLWAWEHDRNPIRCFDGMPVFNPTVKVHIMGAEDYKRATVAVNEELARRRTTSLPPREARRRRRTMAARWRAEMTKDIGARRRPWRHP